MKLKHLVLIFILISLMSCYSGGSGSSDDSTTNTTTVTGDDPPVVIIPTPEPVDPDATSDTTTDTSRFIPLFAVKTGDNLYFSNHEEMFLWNTGNIEKAGSRIFSHESDLITLDIYGEEISRTDILDDQTPIIPNKIKVTENGIYYCTELTPQESLTLGAQARTHTIIYKDGNRIDPQWYFNQFECKNIKSVGENVFLYDHLNAIHVINGIYDNIALVENNEFFIHDIDTNFREIFFNGVENTFGFNYATVAEQWIKYEGTFYSENGYTWDATNDLLEMQNNLHDFNATPYPITPAPINGQSPVMLKAGVFDGLLWWIECNSGLVFSFDARTDELNQRFQIYNGDGLKSTGILKRGILKPLIVDEKLYFSNGGIFTIELDTGIINAFFGGAGEVVRYD